MTGERGIPMTADRTKRTCLAVILAAGESTRMKSSRSKVLHPVGARAMLDHAIDAAEALGCERIVVVVGAHSPEVRAHVEKRLGADSIAVQDPPLGTGHAVRAAEERDADPRSAHRRDRGADRSGARRRARPHAHDAP